MPCNEASIKTPQDGIQTASWLVNTWSPRESGAPGKGVVEALSPSSRSALFISSIWCYKFYPFISKMFLLSCVSHSCKLIEPKQGVLGTSDV